MALVKTHDMSDFSVYLLDSFYTCFLLEQLALAKLANYPAMVKPFFNFIHSSESLQTLS